MVVILIAGGTGTLGRAVVGLLTARGETVRVLTRDGNRAQQLFGPSVDVRTGDIRDPASVAAAVHGATCVVSAVHGFTGGHRSSPAIIDRDGNRTLIRAAMNAGVDHMILVSVFGAAPDHPMSLHRMKYAAEQALVGSGLGWTVVRPAAFLETWTELIGAHLADQGKTLVFGPGDNPINFVPVHDVATVIDKAIHDRTLRASTVDVTGPDNLTFNDIARQLIAATDGRGRTTHIPLTALRLMAVLAKPLAPAFARQAHAAVVMNTADMAVHGDPHIGSRPTGDIRKIVEQNP